LRLENNNEKHIGFTRFNFVTCLCYFLTSIATIVPLIARKWFLACYFLTLDNLQLREGALLSLGVAIHRMKRYSV
jgi:hypothetical protein